MSDWRAVLDDLEAEADRLERAAEGDVEAILDPPPALDVRTPCPPELLPRAAAVLSRLRVVEVNLQVHQRAVAENLATLRRPSSFGATQPATARYVDTRT